MLKLDDAACNEMIALCGEAVAFVSKVQTMEDDEQPGGEQWLPLFPQYKTDVVNESSRVGELLTARWVGDIEVGLAAMKGCSEADIKAWAIDTPNQKKIIQFVQAEDTLTL